MDWAPCQARTVLRYAPGALIQYAILGKLVNLGMVTACHKSCSHSSPQLIWHLVRAVNPKQLHCMSWSYSDPVKHGPIEKLNSGQAFRSTQLYFAAFLGFFGGLAPSPPSAAASFLDFFEGLAPSPPSAGVSGCLRFL